ncbi:MAG: DUF3336 domain-containing protein [Gammaproteobacteria bacterium]|nr:MAG: DUF3336 domain-containing protein [Gammaproteobacteria bacterium]
MKSSRNKKVERLEAQLAEASTYDQWHQIALELDELSGQAAWKQELESDLYNAHLILDRYNEIRQALERRDHVRLIRSLRQGLHHDLGNMGNPALFARSRVGTKLLIENYLDVVCHAIRYVAETDFPELPLADKLDYFKDIALAYGSPALLLSGGATLGLFHIGVVKALWERRLLPRVIAGSSVGSIIAAMLGTRTDDELDDLLHPENHNLQPWKWQGWMAGLSGRGFMDNRQLERCLRENIGEYTFLEAYERSGRSINITVSPVHEHQRERLLSGYTSPYLLVWSASMASCSVPGVFAPVQLMKKDELGQIIPYQPRLRWVDGSVVSDLPVDRLRHLYDVNFTLVSQTNPHVVPFLRASKHRGRPGLLGLPWRMLSRELKFHGKELANYLRQHSDNEVVRQVAGQAYTILAQRYSGDVTIAPRYTLAHYRHMLSNPSPELVARLTLEGERATWPHISRIRAHSRISLLLSQVVRDLKDRMRKGSPALRLVQHS